MKLLRGSWIFYRSFHAVFFAFCLFLCSKNDTVIKQLSFLLIRASLRKKELWLFLSAKVRLLWKVHLQILKRYVNSLGQSWGAPSARRRTRSLYRNTIDREAGMLFLWSSPLDFHRLTMKDPYPLKDLGWSNSQVLVSGNSELLTVRALPSPVQVSCVRAGHWP